MEKFVLTGHAKTVMAERSITEEWVQRVLSNPEEVETDKQDPTLSHGLGRIPEHGDRVLRVVYNHSVSPPSVVTAYFDRSMKGKL